MVWATYDGDDVLVSTLVGRRKQRNLEADPRATVLRCPREQPYSYAELRCRVAMTTEGGRELIEQLSPACTGGPYTSDGPDDVRVALRLTPEKVLRA